MAVTFAELTTFRVGGPISRFERTDLPGDLAALVTGADAAGEPVLVLGGGSNLLVADTEYRGLVVQDTRQDIVEVDSSGCGGTTLRVSAGTNWDDFVKYAVDRGVMGVEALSGIPGTVGAAPVQNIGAYGQEVAETLAAVEVLDRLTGQRRRLALFDLHLGYRTSILKRSRTDAKVGGGRTWGDTGRWVVLEVEFQMRNSTLSAPIRYRELAAKLGVELGDRVPSAELREAVLQLRRSKGMLLEPADHDTWSAGSFFTNPVISDAEAARLPEGAPKFPVENRSLVASIGSDAPVIPGIVKTSAAWLISRAGFERGYRVSPDAPAALSTKHVLALTNQGGATTADVLRLGRTVRAGVEDRFHVKLEPEPVLVNCSL